MKKFFLDANLLIYLNTMAREERTPIDNFFKAIIREDLFTDVLVIDETLYVSKKRYGVPYELTMSLLKRVLLPHIQIIALAEEDLQALGRYLSRYELRPSDALHLAAMEKSGISSIVSEDEDFDRVEGIKRFWLERTPT